MVLDKPYSDWPGHKTSRLPTVDLYSPWLQSVFGDSIYEDELIVVYWVGGRVTALADAD